MHTHKTQQLFGVKNDPETLGHTRTLELESNGTSKEATKMNLKDLFSQQLKAT